jgi:hypothetical protein
MSTVAGTGRKDGRSRAGFLLDITLSIFLLAVAYVIVLQRLGVTEGGVPGAGAPFVAAVGVVLLWMVTLFAYSTAFEALLGSTPGGVMAGLRVVSRGGGRASPGPVVSRNLFRYLYPFVRRHADRIAGTEVVALGNRAPRPAGPPWGPPHDDVEEAKRRVGLEAELAVAAELYPLVRLGYFLFSNVEHPAFGDIDHVLVGPGAVFVVETKGHRGVVTANEISGELMRDGEPFERDFRAQAERQANHLAKALFKSERSVRYFICFARGQVRPNRRGELPARVCSLRDLRPSIEAFASILTPQTARKIVRRIERVYGSFPDN